MSEMTPEEFWAALAPIPKAPPVFYRLYYNEQGHPLFYSMEDLPGNYIEVDKSTYLLSPAHVRVRNGKLVEIVTTVNKKLVNSVTGTPCDPRDVCVVVAPEQEHIKWDLKVYETD